MSLNDSLSVYERAQLAVWDYPVSDRYTKMWQTMNTRPPNKNHIDKTMPSLFFSNVPFALDSK